jgi:hypothetical protein
MKISVDGVELFTLTETQKKVFQYELPKETCEATIKGLVRHVLENKFNRCFMRLENEWGPKLLKDRDSLPLNKEKYAQEVFKHKDYKDRSAKMKEAEAKRLNKAVVKDKEPVIEAKVEGA